MALDDLRLRRAAGDQRILRPAIVAILLVADPPTLLVVVRVTAVLHPLALLGCLGDRVEDAEIMFGVLEVALRHHPVAGAGGVPPELQILLEQLLCGAAHAQIGPVAIEHVVAVQRDLAVMVPYRASATAATAAATAARTMITASHAFHVHQSVEALS